MESPAENPQLQDTEELPRTCIIQTPLAESPNSTAFSLTNKTPEKYRLVDCDAFLAGTIKVYEYENLPKAYATISYVWNGVKKSPQDESPTIRVHSGDEWNPVGAPISVEMIKDACRAALGHKYKLHLFWLDRFCIDKSDGDDDRWQTQKMHTIYESSRLCIVFPGGLTRLTSLSEKTTWVERGWTLQEALAPEDVQVVFQWTGGNKNAKSSPKHKGIRKITEVTPGRCAMASLRLILDCAITGSLYTQVDRSQVDLTRFTQRQIEDNHFLVREDLSISIFGANQGPNDERDFRRVFPNVAALAVILNTDMSNDPCRKDHCLWKSMFMRSTRDPVDMVFSAMGLFGVTLDPNDFDGNERIRPIIALAQKVLLKGYGATWLGISFLAPPCPFLSTFPSFPVWSKRHKPEIGIPGKGRIEASRFMLNEYVDSRLMRLASRVYEPDLPGDQIDDNGYLTLRARSLPVVRGSPNSSRSRDSNESWEELGYPIRATDGSNWCKLGSSPPNPHETGPPAYAILMGFFVPYNPDMSPAADFSNLRGFIVVQSRDDESKYSIDSYFMLSIKVTDPIMKWERREFCVGGPYDVDVVEPLDKPLEDDTRLHIPAPDTTTTFGNVDSRYLEALRGDWPLVEEGAWREGGRSFDETQYIVVELPRES
ncbi:heterokaryon incompatibility protein, partial [Rhizoctonia solani AG-3 Rhs1AP]